jgi:hypothetical protein
MIAVAIVLLGLLLKTYIYPDQEYDEAQNLVKTSIQVADIYGSAFSVSANDTGGVLRTGSDDNSFRTYTYGFDIHGSKQNGSLLVRIIQGASQQRLQIIEPDGDKEKIIYEKIENRALGK